MISTETNGLPLASHPFERILLIKPSSLGDIVHAMPVLHGLRRRFPNARIDWLCAKAFVPLLEGHPDLTGVLSFDRGHFGRMDRSLSAVADFIGFVRDLRSRRYDLTVDLQGLFRTGFLSRASGAPVRLGFRDAREGATIFYTHAIAADSTAVHAVDRNFGVARSLGFPDASVKFTLPISERANTEAGRLLNGGGHREDFARVVLAPGARWETKVWPEEKFVETINELSADGSAGCILVGSPGEVALCDRVAAQCRVPPLNLAGKTGVDVLAAVIRRADLVVCHDSAVAHVAAALNRPLLCLVGPTNHLRTGPYRRERDVIRLPLDCAPCYFRKLSQCGFQHRCMRELASATVWTAIRRSLNENQSPVKLGRL